jgi:hypothetical protein
MLHDKFAFSLDATMIIPTYESMERDIYNAPPDEEEEETSAQASTGTRHDEYKREEKEVPDTKHNDPDLDFDKRPTPGTDKVPKDTVSENPATGPGCPHGLVYGKSFMDKPEPRACKTCDCYDGCVAAE